LGINDLNADGIERGKYPIALLRHNRALPLFTQYDVHHFEAPDWRSKKLFGSQSAGEAIGEVIFIECPSQRRARVNDDHNRSFRASWTERTISSALSLGNSLRSRRSSWNAFAREPLDTWPR
jgi:hypothetical protein